uniref:Uncharacterized protein n=1 Tax=Anguilla anguilla TaxID=7936 RepID=A0A0E9VER0_ANGAN
MLHSPTRLVFYTIDYFTRNIHFLDRLLFIYIHQNSCPTAVVTSRGGADAPV